MLKSIDILPGNFELECGQTLPDLKLAYHTDGILNEAKDNVIMICHAFSANSDVSDWWSDLYGKGKLFDPSKYFIICINILGSPYGSSSPKDINPKTGNIWGNDFPLITVRDQVRAQIEVLTHLQISKLHLLVGPSYGGHQAQELSIIWDGDTEHLVLIGTSAKETAWSIAIHESQRLAILADPTFQMYDNAAGTNGMKAARAMAMLNYRTIDSFIDAQSDSDSGKLDDFKAASYVRYQGQKMTERFTAHCYYTLSKSLDTHHVGRNRESIEKALASINSKTLVIGISSDQLIPPKEQQFLARHIPNAQYLEIDSAYGHDGFLIEHETISEKIGAFIDS